MRLRRLRKWAKWGFMVASALAVALAVSNPSKGTHHRYGVALLYPVLLTAVLLWYADRRRFAPGRCAKCGYDRAGLGAVAKCPECGTVPAK
jgi:peptidoglycan/LPS O-acetylase OafA/YrhL